MNNNEIIGLIIGCLAGLLGIILSVCIKKYKMTSLIAGFNPNKHDEEKISKIVGDNIFLAGIIIIFFAILNVVAKEYSDILNYAQSVSVIVILINITYRTNKSALKDK